MDLQNPFYRNVFSWNPKRLPKNNKKPATGQKKRSVNERSKYVLLDIQRVLLEKDQLSSKIKQKEFSKRPEGLIIKNQNIYVNVL